MVGIGKCLSSLNENVFKSVNSADSKSMDIEQFKMIVELLQEAGAGTKEVAIFYIVMEALPSILHFLAVSLFIVLLYKAALAIVTAVTSCNRYDIAWKATCDHAGETGDDDCWSVRVSPTDRDVRQVLDKIEKKS